MCHAQWEIATLEIVCSPSIFGCALLLKISTVYAYDNYYCFRWLSPNAREKKLFLIGSVFTVQWQSIAFVKVCIMSVCLRFPWFLQLRLIVCASRTVHRANTHQHTHTHLTNDFVLWIYQWIHDIVTLVCLFCFLARCITNSTCWIEIARRLPMTESYAFLFAFRSQWRASTAAEKVKWFRRILWLRWFRWCERA